MKIDWTHYKSGLPFYEDIQRNYRPDFTQLALDGFIEIPLTSFISVQSRIGLIVTAGDYDMFLPEGDLLARVSLSNSRGMNMYILSGVFVQQTEYFRNIHRYVHFIRGVELGIGFDLEIIPPVELIFQKPLDPLAYVSLPRRNDTRIEIPLNYWLWRVGIVLPIWEIGE